MSLGLSRQILRLPDHLRLPHLAAKLPSTLDFSRHNPLFALSSPSYPIPQGFTFFPVFYNPFEQQILLESALMRLDHMGGIKRINGKKIKRSKAQIAQDRESLGLQGWFLPTDAYNFEQSHFDKVIQSYRETLVSNGLPDLPQSQTSFAPTPSELIKRLHSFFPDQSRRLTTHALHLSPTGSIGGHVDSVNAMGDIIVGVSLGADRVLRLEKEGEHELGALDIVLPSGSVYIQSGEARYKYRHSVLNVPEFNGQLLSPGHRVSIMIRDEKPFNEQNLPSDPNPTPPPPASLPTFHPPTELELAARLQADTALALERARALQPTSFVPLSSADEMILAGEDPSLVESALEQPKKTLDKSLPLSQRAREWRNRKGEEKLPQDLLKAGMRARRWK
ncbi:Uncharacterized conserved protein [Phaffia rhodozyma]|uniref:Uncharacterized conserved protein n=1 Tax=Phaffia rhodozyma TaxID=264483 RepID=A0A0F7SI25_PHARH|nr:Uncharacterized conserved protein [Phaffia rhodozyma]